MLLIPDFDPQTYLHKQLHSRSIPSRETMPVLSTHAWLMQSYQLGRLKGQSLSPRCWSGVKYSPPQITNSAANHLILLLLIISKVLWHSADDNFTGNFLDNNPDINHKNVFEIYTFKITANKLHTLYKEGLELAWKNAEKICWKVLGNGCSFQLKIVQLLL